MLWELVKCIQKHSLCIQLYIVYLSMTINTVSVFVKMGYLYDELFLYYIAT